MGFSRRTLNYPERISLYDVTLIMNMVDPVAIGIETLKINNR